MLRCVRNTNNKAAVERNLAHAANTPEHREYIAIGVIRDEEVTLSSDIIEAVYGG